MSDPHTPPHFVVGHKNPDADTVVCAHVLAWLHRQRNPDSPAEPIRLGEVNRQTKWLFAEAGCSLPQLRKSCLYRADEIARSVPVVERESPLCEALETMQRAGTDFVVVVDDDRRPLGIVSDRSQRTNYLLQCNIEDFVGTLLNFDHLRRGLPLEALSPCAAPDIQRIEVPMHKSTVSGDWDARTALIIGDRELFLDTINSNPPGAVILTGVPEERAEQIAAMLACPAYRYSGSVISMLTRLPGCFPAAAAMIEDFTAVDTSAREDAISRKLKDAASGLMVTDSQGRVAGTISAMDLLNLARPKVSLVDHSERGQSIDGLQDAEVVEIIDHHRLGDIETIEPLHIDVRPLGSTASILHDRIKEAGVELPPDIAKLLLGALVSDTLLLTSPTCTEGDRKRAKALAKVAGVTLEAFGLELLRQNDELPSATPEKLVGRDCKQFSYNGVAFMAAQIETVDLSALTPLRAEQIEAAFLEAVRAGGMTFGALMVTDVLAGDSRIFIVSDDPRWRHALRPPQPRDSPAPWLEPSFVSRKKQLIPLLLSRIKKEISG